MGTQSEETQHILLEAIENADLSKVHRVIEIILNDNNKKAILTSPNRRPKHRRRTLLQAAAMSGEITIYDAVQGAFDSVFPPNANGNFKKEERTKEMMRQLEMEDGEKMTLVMHSAAGGNSAIVKAVAQEIQPSQTRRHLRHKDKNRMTFPMHAVNAQSDRMTTAPTPAWANSPRQGQGAPAGTATEVPTPPSAQNIPAPSQSARPEQQGDSASPQPDPEQQRQQIDEEEEQLDSWVPVVSGVLEVAKKCLWMADYRKLLEARDVWGRSIVEHARASGRREVFETVFDAIREDIYDETMAYMFDAGVDSGETQTPISKALQTTRGRTIQPLVAEKTKILEKEVALRAEASTVAAKIQSFIPANLIVVFQLLLSEFDEESDDPLYMLIVLCIIAPFWSWGSEMASTKDSERKNTSARRTSARYFLAIPATFFWGTGTSKIGTYSLNWADSVSAAALAVATIVIPALDSFFSGRGARETNALITFAILDLWDWLKKIFPPRGDEPDNRSPERPQQQLEQHHQEGNENQGVGERKGEDDQDGQLSTANEIPGRVDQGNTSSLNTSPTSSARRPRPATNNNYNNAPASSIDEMEAGEMNPTGRQDTLRSRNPKPGPRQVVPQAAISGHQ